MSEEELEVLDQTVKTTPDRNRSKLIRQMVTTELNMVNKGLLIKYHEDMIMRSQQALEDLKKWEDKRHGKAVSA
jgi:hypothetical protein